LLYIIFFYYIHTLVNMYIGLSQSCKLYVLISSDEYLFGGDDENLPKIISVVKEVSQSNFISSAEIWIYLN
jgi:hypothetical protein